MSLWSTDQNDKLDFSYKLSFDLSLSVGGPVLWLFF